MRLRVTRVASLVGNAIGVAIGCLLGMLPLLFMTDPDAVEAVKHREKVTRPEAESVEGDGAPRQPAPPPPPRQAFGHVLAVHKQKEVGRCVLALE